MRLGLIARADNSGLGIQTWEFYKHMKPAETLLVDISKLNRNRQYYNRYLDNLTQIAIGIPTPTEIEHFLNDVDVVFIAEAAYNPLLYTMAREKGVKTAVQYNYEFMDWLVNPDYPKPDMLIAPSKWHYKDVQNWCDANGVQHVYLHCPVNRQLLVKRDIRQARNFLHVAGRSAAHDRNGTEIVIQAAKYLKTEAKITVHFQGEQGLPHQATHTVGHYQAMAKSEGVLDKNLFIRQQEYDNYPDIYHGFDVMVLPRRYGGNCLPMNEALSCGMPVIMPNISPNYELLPGNWLVPAHETTTFTPRTEVQLHTISPMMLAQKIDYFYNMSESAMWYENLHADKISSSISWETLGPKYTYILEKLCAS